LKNWVHYTDEVSPWGKALLTRPYSPYVLLPLEHHYGLVILPSSAIKEKKLFLFFKGGKAQTWRILT
jgi:hypothetical protein